MRWFAFSISVLVLLIWQYQSQSKKPLSDYKSNQLEPALVKKLETEKLAKFNVVKPKPPLLDAEQHWLQPVLKTVFDHYLLEHVNDNNAMWTAFEEYCLLQKACSKITDLFKRYISYKRALVTLDQPVEPVISQISQQLDNLHTLRLSFFSNHEVSVLFAFEAQWQQIALERLTIRQDPNISTQQKNDLLKQHYQSLNGMALKTVQPSLQLAKVSVLATQQMLNLDNYNELAAEFGPEAANRLIELNNKRTAWQLKLDKFNHQSNQLSETLKGTELAEAIESLKTDMFDENERKRLNALF